MIARQTVRQRDFSGGEMDEEAARRDDAELVRASGRQMSNKRVLPTGGMMQRPGRLALQVADGNRTDDIRISEDETYRIGFGAGTLVIRDPAGTQLLSESGFPWSNSTVDQIVWDKFDKQVFVCFPGMATRVLTVSGGAWSGADFAFDVEASGLKRVPFYRFTTPGITLQPSDVTGTVAIVFSADVLTAAWVGTRIRYNGRQMTVATVTDARNGTATVNERLFPSQRLTVTIDPNSQFSVGDAVESSTTGGKGIISAIGTLVYAVDTLTPFAAGTGYSVGDEVSVGGGVGTAAHATVDSVDGGGGITGLTVTTAGYYTTPPSSPATLTTVTGSGTGATATVTTTSTSQTIEVSLTSATGIGTDLVGPNGSATVSLTVVIAPAAISIWDEEMINDLRGWPRSVFVDQNRLGFCDLPALGRAVAWSAVDSPFSFYPGANPDDAMVELLKGAGRIYHVVPGDDEFVFSDIGVFYIPISENNPLKPGSVTFRSVTSTTSSSIKPVATPEGLAFVDAGGTRVIGIRATGQTTKPYISRSISDFHTHLITGPKALASGFGDPSMAERYLYLLNTDGSLALARYDADKNWVGWLPWTAGGTGAFKWVSIASGGAALFTTAYSTATLVEALDIGAWLDAQITVHSAPAALAPPSGKGPLWFLAGATVAIMDGARPMDTRVVDANGNLVAIEGEDLSSANLIAGYAWQETFEPFVPHVSAGNAVKQTVRRRKFGRIAVKAKHATGYVCANRRVPAWRLGDDLTAAPPTRDETQFFVKMGRTVDPTFEVVKDIPGPMTVTELSYEVTV